MVKRGNPRASNSDYIINIDAFSCVVSLGHLLWDAAHVGFEKRHRWLRDTTSYKLVAKTSLYGVYLYEIP